MRAFYSTLWWLALPAVLTRALIRGRRDPRYLAHMGERFARWPAGPRSDLWMHAVSMGEVRALRVLIATILTEAPACRILVTVTTPAGRDAARDAFGNRVEVRYLPYDLAPFVRHVLRARQPGALLLMEAELWPNLIACANQSAVPVVLVNARLSARSAKRHARVALLSRPMFAGLAQVLCQTQADRSRFIAAGCAPQTVQVVGSLKFDRLPHATQQATETHTDGPRPLRLALGCPRRGEEQVLGTALIALWEHLPNLEVVLVPRQVGDAGLFATHLRSLGVRVDVTKSFEGATVPQGGVLIVDATGILESVYAGARAAYVGGALTPLGGHSVAEAAAMECPVVIGPHHHNNAIAVEALCAAGAAQVVENAHELTKALVPWLQDPLLGAHAGRLGKVALDRLAGASARTFAVLQEEGLLPAGAEFDPGRAPASAPPGRAVV